MPRAGARWALYAGLLLLRFLGVFQRGYVHPDEFYQAGSEIFFGRPSTGGVGLELEAGDGDAERGGAYVADRVPWEFEPRHAVRSIVPPVFMTVLPLRLYAIVRPRSTGGGAHAVAASHTSFLEASVLWTPAMHSLSGREVLLVPRLFMALLSVVFLDGSLWRLLQHARPTRASAVSGGPPVEVLVLASAWPCLVFGARTFTNGLEAMALACLLALVARSASAAPTADAAPRPRGEGVPALLLIGATCAVGLFVRFTFVFFAFPVVAAFLWHRAKGRDSELKGVLRDLVWLVLSFLLVDCAFIWVDTQYYSWQERAACDGAAACVERAVATRHAWLCYIAPWNALRYNSRSANLAEHGLHPRITHAAVNMPLLFGPLALAGYAAVARRMHGAARGRSVPHRVERNYCTASWSCGLLVLSCAPHQEPRFLLPALVPLVFLYGRHAVGVGADDSGTDDSGTASVEGRPKGTKATASRLAFWTAFNALLYVFFGWVHQGGLVPSLMPVPDGARVRSGRAAPRAVVYYKTYMPPTFLARGSAPAAGAGRLCPAGDEGAVEETCPLRDRSGLAPTAEEAPRDCAVLDLKGAHSSVLLETLRAWLPCPAPGDAAASGSRASGAGPLLHLVSPPAVVLPLLAERDEASATPRWREYALVVARKHPGHVSTEDWPAWEGSVRGMLRQLRLDVYAVSCAQ